MIVAQSLANLRSAYGPDGAQNFLANCRLQLFMAPADSDTPDYVSKAIGDFTRKSRSKSWTMGQIGKSNIQERDEGARLLRPEELRGLSNDDCVLLIQDSNPVLAQKVRYFEDRVLNPIFEGQVGEYPLPEKLIARTSSQPIDGIDKHSLANPDNDEISKKDFDKITSSQGDLLEQIREVKSAVTGV